MRTNFYQLCCAAFLSVCATGATAQIITPYAGNYLAGFGYSGDGGSAVSAKLYHPKSVAVDDTGNVFIADTYNNVIRKVTPAGAISTFSGVVAGGFGGDGGDATFAAYDHPAYIAFDASYNLYVCDGGNARIRKIERATNIITTVVGDGNNGYLGDGGPATAAEVNLPAAIALDPAGNLYIADENNNVIRKVTTSGVISTIAGNVGVGGYSGEGGPATAANVDFPYGIAVDPSGNVYFSLYYDSRVCKIDNAGIITTYAGVGGGQGNGGAGDGGPATAATFDSPWGLALDVAGNLYICDDGNDRVRKVTPTGTVTAFAGSGSYNYNGDYGPALSAAMRDPVGLAAAPDGSVYIAEYNNHVVRKVAGTFTHPPVFTGGASQTLTVCENAAATSINSQLAASDVDLGQTEVWSIMLAPLHGTAVTAFTATSTGNIITPTGLTYTPTVGYNGNDSFKVKVYDGTAYDSIMVYVTINVCNTTAPTFTGGHNQTLTVCENAAATSINTLMAVSDADFSQTETWSTVTAPAHGTLVAAYTTTSTGNILHPTGLTYTPATGYNGTDVFKVQVTDGIAFDTTTVAVTINDCSIRVPGINGAGEGISVFPNPTTGAFTFSLASPTQEKVQLVVTNIVGEKVKEMTADTNTPVEIELNQPAGIYILHATTSAGKWSAKITVTR